MQPTSPQNDIYKSFSFFSCFCSPFSLFDQAFNSKVSWNKTDKITTFTRISPHVTMLPMLKAIRISQDGMADEVSGNIIAYLMKRGTFGSFSTDMMKSLLEGTWNKVEYGLKDKRNTAGQLEECFDSK